jgi:hypothetical protein
MDYNNFKGGFFVKLGVFTVLFSDKKLDDMLDHVASKGIEAAVKLGTRAVILEMPIVKWMNY